jgi:hypothetical protein
MSIGGRLMSGNLHMAFLGNNDELLGYFPYTINATAFTVQEEDGEAIQRISRMRDNPGRVLEEEREEGQTNVAISVDTVSRELLEIAFRGEAQSFDEAGGSATSESVTAILDKDVPLAKVLVSSVVVTDGEVSPTTYTAGEDYVVDVRNGLLRALSTGAITEGQVLDVSYTFGARKGFKIPGGTRRFRNVALLFDGKSRRQADSGKMYRIQIHKVSLRMANELQLQQEGFMSFDFNGPAVQHPSFVNLYDYEEYEEVV